VKDVRSHYDVVLVGDSIPLAAAGALLARRGFRVAWIGRTDRPTTYVHDRHVLSRTLQSLPVVETPAFRRVIAELALGPLLRRKVLVPRPLFQAALPGHRFDVPLAGDARTVEMLREFPELQRPLEEFHAIIDTETTALDALFGEDLAWPPEGFFERRRAARLAGRSALVGPDAPDVLEHLPANHAFRTFVGAITRMATATDPDRLDAVRLARAYGAMLRGGAFYEGGRDALHALMLEQIARHGGEVRTRDEVVRVLLERGRVRAVELAVTDERLGCGTVLTSLRARAAYRLAGHSPSPTASERLLSIGTRYHRFMMSVVMMRAGLPEAMGTRVFAVADRQRSLREENLLAVEVGPADDAGHVVLTVQVLLPEAGVREGESYLARQRERVLDALRSLIPFLDEHLIATDSPHDGRPWENLRTGTQQPVQARAAVQREPMAVIEDPAPGAYLGLCGLPAATEIPGMYLVNPQVVPGLGEEGEWLAAVSVARAITRSDPRREKLRRDLWTRSGV